jgi:hypothetical protein
MTLLLWVRFVLLGALALSAGIAAWAAATGRD